jgi:hypothetical protein
MMKEQDIDDIARDVARTTLSSAGIVSVKSTSTTDSAGNAALRITIVLTPESTASISGGAALNTLDKLQRRLQEKGEDRFPIIEYATPEELKSVAS